MQSINYNYLKENLVLPQDLYSSHGVKLLNSGTTLSDTLINRLKQIGQVFFLADSAREIAQQNILHEIDPNTISVGDIPSPEIISMGGIITAETADIIETHHTQALALGTFKQNVPEPHRIACERRKLADEVIRDCAARWSEIQFTVPSNDNTITLEIDQNNPWLNHHELCEWRDNKVEQLNTQYSYMLAGIAPDYRVFARIVDELIGKLRQNYKNFAQISLLCPRAFDYLPDHALSTAVLAIAIAARLNWPITDIRLAGLSGLLHDTGMLLLPQTIRTQENELSDLDQSRIFRHPAYSVSMLISVPEIPDVVRCAIYRHHERDNGFGYPHGLLARNIGLLPRLLAIADAVSAVCEPRPFRDQPLPHDAITQIIELATEGFYHRPMIRALVESIGLYPIGSYVLLSTGDIATVTGIHPEHPDRPIVSIYHNNGRINKKSVDLMDIEPWELSILDGCKSPCDAAA